VGPGFSPDLSKYEEANNLDLDFDLDVVLDQSFPLRVRSEMPVSNRSTTTSRFKTGSNCVRRGEGLVLEPTSPR
jgi:hypothetical protein